MKKKIQLSIGCGGYLAPGFINVDVIKPEEITQVYEQRGQKIPKTAKYVQGTVQELPFASNYADYIETNDMVEHLPMRTVAKAFQEMHRVLKPGGKLLVGTTDFDDVARTWLEVSQQLTDKLTKGENTALFFDPTHTHGLEDGWAEMTKRRVNTLMMILYGNQVHGGEYHMNAFTPAIMFLHLTHAGFKPKNIKIVVHPRGTTVPSLPGSWPVAKGEKPGPLLTSIILATATKK